MKKEDAKKAFTEAQKEVKEKSIEKLKEFIKKTLEARERLIKTREEASRKIKILDKDILDLKEGRIDRIEERQKADPKASEVSVALVKKVEVKEIHHHHYDRWYWPYQFTWTYPDPVYPELTAGSNVFDTGFTLNNSMAKDFSAGTYKLDVNGGGEKISYVS